MQWSVNVGHSALSGVTGDETIYSVHFLEVPASDDLRAALMEFLERLFDEAPAHLSGRWEILLFELWPGAGLLNATFTTLDRAYDHPVVFKLASEEIEREYDRLPNPEDGNFVRLHRAMLEHWWRLLLEVARDAKIARKIRNIRRVREMPIYRCCCNDEDTMSPLAI